jgi:ankyrin repeat protein
MPDWTPLHLAVVKRHLMIAFELIKSGAHIDAEVESRYEYGRPLSSLKLAARNNDVDMLGMLLANGAGKRDYILVGALREAISTDAVEAVRFLIDDEGRRQKFAHKNIGALVESTEMLEVLSEAGLLAVEEPIRNPNDIDDVYWTHLTYAAWAGDDSLVMSLLDRGANPIKAAPSNSPCLELTPLAFAAQKGHLSIADLLLDHGADPTLAGRGSLPPAQLALAKGYGDIASLILKHCHGAVPEVRGAASAATTEQEMGTESLAYDTQGPIELDLRHDIDNNNLSNIKQLLEKDSLIRCSYVYGNGFVSPLGYAIRAYKLPIAEALIEAGVDINVGGDSFNPIMEAASDRNSESMRLLIKNGADVNFQTSADETPLLRCFDLSSVLFETCCSNGKTAKMLIQAGAHVNVSDAFGRTPLGAAVQVGNLEAVEILVNAGAYIDQACSINSRDFPDVDEVDRLMLTPLSWAARNGHDEVVQFLLKNGADWKSLKNDPALKYVHRHLMESWFSTRSDDGQSILPALNLFGPVTPKRDAVTAAAGISRHMKSVSGKDRWCYEQESEEGLLERSLAFLKDISHLLSQHLEMAFAKVHHIRLELIVLISVCIFLLAQQVVQCTSLYKAKDFKLLAAVILVSFVLGGWMSQTAG